jgi:hypothetical protein
MATNIKDDKKDKHIQFEILPGSLERPFIDHFPRYMEGLVRTIPGGYVYHPEYSRHAEKYYSLKPRKDDVWIRTFPRSGAIIHRIDIIFIMIINLFFYLSIHSCLRHDYCF